jgi:predicted alpha/beta hydrolase family esterase
MVVRRAVIVHGAFGSPSENWFPWLGTRLRGLGIETYCPTFPTPEGQTLDGWRRVFADEVGSLTNDMVLIGHSLGPAFILDLLNQSNEPVAATYMVSAFLGLLGLPEFDAVNQQFVCRDDLDWDSIRSRAGVCRLYAGEHDPYVPTGRAVELAEKLSADLLLVSGGGHLNTSAGFTEFPALLRDIEYDLTRV